MGRKTAVNDCDIGQKPVSGRVSWRMASVEKMSSPSVARQPTKRQPVSAIGRARSMELALIG